MLRCLLVVIALALTNTSPAKDWQIERATSSLSFSGTYQDEPFQGKFRKFDAAIHYDPADLSTAQFDVNVDITSVTTDNEERDSTLICDDFFAVSKFPKAHFASEKFSKAVDGKIEAQGNLTIRDKKRPIVLLVKFDPSGGSNAVLEVDTELNRLDFDIGTGEWKDLKLIGPTVRVHGHLVLTASHPEQ